MMYGQNHIKFMLATFACARARTHTHTNSTPLYGHRILLYHIILLPTLITLMPKLSSRMFYKLSYLVTLNLSARSCFFASRVLLLMELFFAFVESTTPNLCFLFSSFSFISA